ncbi:MAG: transglycosylase SLT domain-containing protein [Candidatus Shapirobacteria bacterium]
MPIVDAVKNRNLLVPVRVSNKAADAVNVKIAAGSLPATISSKDLLKLQNAISGSQKVYYTKKIKQERSFLKYLGVTLVGAVATGIGVYVGRSLYKKMVSKTIGKVKSDVFGTARVAMYNVFGKALEFIKTKFASMIELVKNDFHEILGDKLGAVWDAAKGLFGWVKKIFSWWIKFFLIRFAARTVLTKYGGFSREQAVAMTRPIKFFMSKFFRFPLYFKLFGKFLGYIKDVVMVSGFLSKNFKSKVLDKIDLFKEKFLGIVNSERFQKIKALFEKLGESKLAKTISEYASKLKGGLKALAETFGKGNKSLKDKIFSFVKSMKDSILAKYTSIRDEARLHNQLKKIKKREAKDREAQQAKNERNARTKATLKAKFKKGIFGNQVGSVGAQPPGEDGGIDFGDIAALIGSYLGLDYLKGKIGSIAKGGLNLGKKLFTTRGGSALLSGGLAAAQGQGVGGTAGAVGGSFAGQGAGALIGGGLGFLLGGPAGAAAGVFAGEMIGGFIGGWIGKNVGDMIEEDIKKGESPSAGSAENAMYEAIVKANLVQTKDLNKFDDKNRDKYLGIGSDVVGWLNEIWKGVLGKVTNTLGGGNSPQTVGAISGGSGIVGGIGTPSIPANASDIIRNPAYAPFIDQAIKATGRTDITPADIARLIQTESNWNPSVTSPKGAMGLMQLMPGTAGNINAYDPEQNINKGVSYYAGLLKKYGGDKEKALAAYNWGEGKLDRALGGANAPMDRSKLPMETKKFLMETYGGPSVKSTGPQLGTDPLTAMFNGIQYASKNFGYEYGGGHGVDPNVTKKIDCTGLVNYGYRTLLDSMAGQLSPEQMAKYKDLTTGGSAELLRKNAGTLLKSGQYGASDIKPGDSIVGLGHGAIAYYDPTTGKTLMAETSYNPDYGSGHTVKSGISTEEYIRKAQQNNMAKISPLTGLTTTSQIADLERQKGLNTAQIQATNTAALQATAQAASNLPGEMSKNATQTNNIISQTMSSGGKQQGQQVNAFEIDDMYVLGTMGLALSILNP